MSSHISVENLKWREISYKAMTSQTRHSLDKNGWAEFVSFWINGFFSLKARPFVEFRQV